MIANMPATDVERMPLWESSSAKHKRGATPSRSAAFRNRIGRGVSPLVVTMSNDLVKSTHEAVCAPLLRPIRRLHQRSSLDAQPEP